MNTFAEDIMTTIFPLIYTIFNIVIYTLVFSPIVTFLSQTIGRYINRRGHQTRKLIGFRSIVFCFIASTIYFFSPLGSEGEGDNRHVYLENGWVYSYRDYGPLVHWYDQSKNTTEFLVDCVGIYDGRIIYGTVQTKTGIWTYYDLNDGQVFEVAKDTVPGLNCRQFSEWFYERHRQIFDKWQWTLGIILVEYLAFWLIVKWQNERFNLRKANNA